MESSIPVQKTKVFRVKVDLDTGRAFENLCVNETTNVNAKLKSLIDSSLKGNKRHFLSGANVISYNKAQNNFSWLVELDSGNQFKILNNLSDDFLENLKKEIDKAVQERNEWVHHRKSNSVDIPSELIGGRE